MPENFSGIRLISRISDIDYDQGKCIICQKAAGLFVDQATAVSASSMLPLYIETRLLNGLKLTLKRFVYLVTNSLYNYTLSKTLNGVICDDHKAERLSEESRVILCCFLTRSKRSALVSYAEMDLDSDFRVGLTLD